jgi:hypothetical protein
MLGVMGGNVKRRKKRSWRPPAQPEPAGTIRHVGKKIWTKLLAVSVALGALLTIGGQIQQISDIYRKINVTVTEWTWSQLLKVNALRFSTATEVSSDYHQNPVCVTEAIPLDLDRDGKATDLLIRYVDRRKLITPEQIFKCEELRQDLFGFGNPLGELFMFAKHQGWSYRTLKPIRFGGAITIRVVSSLVAATYYETDFPSSTIYGYQGGEMAELASYNHMINVGPGDDEETEIFDMASTDTGVQIRAAEGIFRIDWDASDNVYKAVPLQWKDLSREGQAALYVDRSDEQQPKLMLNGAPVQINEHGDATVELNSLDRIVFDPYCEAEKGFKPVPNSLGAIVIDFSIGEHLISCYPSMYQHVVVKIVPS